jgi:hypothetical protein
MPPIQDTPRTSLVGATVYTAPLNINTIPLTCAAAVTAAKNAANKDELLDLVYHIHPGHENPLYSVQANLRPLARNLAKLDDQGQTFSDTVGRDAVQAHLTYIENSYLPIVRLGNTCLKEALEVDQTALKAAQDKLEESQSRLAAITNPEEQVSYYEGWFPMIRPMTEPALLGIFGAAIFMLLVSILVFLRLQGVEINLIVPDTTLFTLPPNATYYIYGGLATGIIGSIAYAYYAR